MMHHQENRRWRNYRRVQGSISLLPSMLHADRVWQTTWPPAIVQLVRFHVVSGLR